jgi:O-antigen/teichoic acid export membrane protein
MAAFCLLVALLAKPILGLLYGEEYTSYSWILAFIALATMLTYLQKPVRIALRGMEVTSPIFRAYVWSTVVFLTLGSAGVYVIGLLGAGLGMVVHPLIMNIVLWRDYRRRVEGS